jgi:hypothetical protein
MAIGGYFELELNDGEEFHPDAIALNSGCNAFELILENRQVEKISLPYYICGDVISSARKLNIPCSFYKIDKCLEPIFNFELLKEGEAFLVVNYFGLKDATITHLAQTVKGLIIDNAQSFFSRPPGGVDTFYSARKFFGVPDGAYLYGSVPIEEPLQRDISLNRLQHLVRRIEYGPQEGYPYYLENEQSLADLPIRSMSKLTQRLLKNINYQYAASKRVKNYKYLRDALEHRNQLVLPWDDVQVPMVYPFLPEGESLIDALRKKKFFIPRYWPDVPKRVERKSWEDTLSDKLIPLPIDHRYNQCDMQKMIEVINHLLKPNR